MPRRNFPRSRPQRRRGASAGRRQRASQRRHPSRLAAGLPVSTRQWRAPASFRALLLWQGWGYPPEPSRTIPEIMRLTFFGCIPNGTS